MKLHTLAHSRAGDKGAVSDISVIAHRPEDYAFLVEVLTVERIEEYFASMGIGAVERFEVPQLHALKFVIHEALAGGVTRSLALDAHGKSLGSSLLDLELPDRQQTRSAAAYLNEERIHV